jgi:hypothetical protein
MYAQTTSRGTFIDFRHNPQQQANYSMTTKSAVVSPSSSHNNNSEFPNSLLSSSSNSVQPSPSAALPLPTLNSSYTHKHSSSDTTFRTPECIGIDPFEVLFPINKIILCIRKILFRLTKM